VSTVELLVRVVALALVVFAGMMLVLYGTSVRNRWGVNVKSTRCPRCNAPPPRFRIPNSLQEFLWGGWTCRACGTRVDKWGRDVGHRLPGSGAA
jgi:hypothetical protein